MDVDPTVLPRFLWKHIMFISRRKKCLIFYVFKVFERKESKIKWIYFKRRDIFFHFYIWLLLFLKSHNLFKIPIDNLLWVKIKFINQSVFLYNHLDFESFVSASLTVDSCVHCDSAVVLQHAHVAISWSTGFLKKMSSKINEFNFSCIILLYFFFSFIKFITNFFSGQN